MFTYRIDQELELVPADPRWAEELFRMTDRNRTYLREWLPWVDGTHSVDHSRAYLQNAREQHAKQEVITAGIFYRGLLCGMIDLHGISKLNRKAAIGYWIDAAHQGKGIMTRACSAMVTYGFRDLGLHRIEILAGTSNRRSRSIPERLGFQLEGIARQAQLVHGQFIDMAVYSVLAHEWSGPHHT
jgi:ribosomal-protein-serine acetyltransferase